VDYCIHAEQDAILNAIRLGNNPENGTVYVLGFANAGPEKGKLTTRDKKVFVCKKCPHTLQQYNVSVCIPHIYGWCELTSKQAMYTGLLLAKDGYWKKFTQQ
jgi:hypothetical protein